MKLQKLSVSSPFTFHHHIFIPQFYPSTYFPNMIPAGFTKDRLRRTKSARSVRKSRPPSMPPEPFDPEIAKYHATAAASRAMLRSSERSSAESRSSYDRLGGAVNVGVPQRRRTSSSIHFTEKSPSINHVSVANGQPTFSPGNDAGNEAPSAALPPISEFGGLDGRKSSLPSSYRRLRKAKSMFSTRHRPSHVGGGISSPRDGNDGRTSDVPLPERTLRNSTSFMRRSQSSRVVRHVKSQDASIQLARAQFLQNAEEQAERESRSSILSAKPRREHKPFRKSFRTTSAPGMDAEGSPSWADQPRSTGFHGRARTLSHTIKNRIKRVLGISRPPGEPNPIQSSPISQPQWAHDSTDPGDPDYAPESNYLHGSPGMEYIPDYSRPQTVQRIRSSESIATSNSRVTSWADSTAANTIAMRKAADRTSLSIIDEYDGMYHAMQQQTPKRSSVVREKTVDSQRLYSALMKRIGRANMQTPDEGVIFGAVNGHRLIPERTPSAYSHRSRQTIRHVGSNESVISPRSFATAHSDSMTPTRHSQRRSRHVLPTITSEQSYGKDDGYENGKVSDDDTGSVIVSRRNPECEPYSPSVYSRTAATPSKKDKVLSSGAFEWEEPGTVTILSSQRTAYSSPKRTAGSRSPGVPIQPSSDWHQWINSEIARIETVPPTRDHYRENAQIVDDDSISLYPITVPKMHGGYQVSTEPPDRLSRDSSDSWTIGKVQPLSNFSRPFSRSPSVRTVVPAKTRPPSASVFPTPGLASDSDNQTYSIPNPFESRITLSPMGSRSNNMLRVPESPTPKRDAGDTPQRAVNEQNRRYSRRLPISQDGKAPLRPFRGHRGQRKITNENVRNEGDTMDQHHKLQDVHSTISSKTMVEMFLSSRRRQMGTEVSEASSSGGAFL